MFAMAPNASFLPHKFLDALKKFQSIIINVSFDGGPKSDFGKIRGGGNYESVLKNVEAIVELVKKNRGSTAGVCLSAMKSNITDLPNFIQSLGHDSEYLSLISPIAVMPPDESLCCYNDVAKDTKEWRASFQAARDAVRLAFSSDPEFNRVATPDNWEHFILTLEMADPRHLREERHYRVRLLLTPTIIEKN